MKRRQKKTDGIPRSAPSSRELAEKFRDWLPEDEYISMLSEIEHPLLPSFRINPLKTSPGFIDFLSHKYHWQLGQVPFCPTGYRVLNAAGADLSATFEHNMGMYYIQETASMLPVELFSTFDPQQLILDMAASPGGKTTHLISRSGDHGLVLANDSSQGRIQSLRFVLQNWGAVNYAVTRFPAERFGDWYPETFDRILLDAPCSMQGLRTAETHPSRPVTGKESRQLSRRQQSMLASAIRALRVGGEVVYSTCTLMPEEDEVVVDNILRQFPGVVEITNAQRVLPYPAPGLVDFPGLAFPSVMQYSVRLWPHRYHTAGFFACHLHKTATYTAPNSPPPVRSLEKAGYHQLTPREEVDFCRQYLDLYGFDLAADLSAFNRALVRHYEQVFIFPLILLERFSSLPVQAAGMLLGEDTPGGFLPSQAWVSRYGSCCQARILRLAPDQAAAWLAGNNLELPTVDQPIKNGYLIVQDSDGIALGRAVVTGSGLKNLLRKRG